PTIARQKCAALTHEWNREGCHEELLALRVMLEELTPNQPSSSTAPEQGAKSRFGRTSDFEPGSLVGGVESSTTIWPRIPPWKRILDVTCILLSMPFWLPLVILLAIWVKVVSPGSIFFRQGRVGYRGTPFYLFK